ncbi:hypothetical protein AYO20_10751 [Fonsecaea nubica]|uniref:Uncharacterized protein n=1 Tax=Fonsecaea nubica TaxID=856822 RepID=A0A178C2I9_9EURO|nr:hypothetical protein AYO20_10751 [Fonsecaea nubica]OAL24139.1 hypothetical protein AYO20_10751 [Fonsecaea nubica]
MSAPTTNDGNAQPATGYTGPPAHIMIKEHILTDEIIKRHNDPESILGGPELILLNEYVQAPDHRLDILREHDMLDAEGARTGSRAQEAHHSIVGWAMANDYFNEEDIAKLKGWFDAGNADESMMEHGWKRQ